MTPMETDAWLEGVLPRIATAIGDQCDPVVALLASGLSWAAIHEIFSRSAVSRSTMQATEAAIELIENATLRT